jgi:phenylglyoxylate dehydrogenase beta subunit
MNKRGLPVIKAVHLPEVGFHSIVVCNQCSNPKCAEICPTGAISKNETNGTVTIDSDKCVGCGLCTLVCPYGGIYYDYTQEKSFKCDRCLEEAPQCAVACPYGVLSFARSGSVYLHFHDEDLLASATGLCAGCPAELAARVMLRVLGRKVITFRTPGCQPIFISRVSSIPTLMTNIASSMTGASRYLRKIGRDDVICACFVGDGATADVGFQPLSGAAGRGEHILYICNDNEAYMNTGIQSSSTTPLGSWTTTTWVGKRSRGKGEAGKYMPLIMLMHNVSYVATATAAYLEDYVLKLEKAKEAVKHGMAYLHLHTPCPTGWRAPVDSGLELSRLAVETNYFPLWEAEDGRLHLTHRVDKPKPLKELTKLQGRFAHLTKEELEQLQQIVDERFALIERLASS